jgi:hypothetical protein
MSKHVSAMGKAVDMAALRSKNEHTRAVGNMNVNARGDIIDSNNNVINDNTKRVNAMYQRTVNAGAKPENKPAPVVTEQKTKEELNLDDMDEPNPVKK